MKRYFVLVGLFVALMCSCNHKPSQQELEKQRKELIEAPKREAKGEAEKNDETTWQYIKEKDDLTGNVTSVNAVVISKNKQPFGRYGQTARLAICISYDQINGKYSTSVMLSFTDDDGMCTFSDFRGSGILAVFDNGEVDNRWSLISMTANRRSLYMVNTDKKSSDKINSFVKQLKASKQARIQVNIKGGGQKTFDFNVEGLQWDFEN